MNEDDQEMNTYHSTFTASLTESTRIHLKPPEQPLPYPQALRLHRDQLPMEPKHWRDLKGHPFSIPFTEAAHDEI